MRPLILALILPLATLALGACGEEANKGGADGATDGTDADEAGDGTDGTDGEETWRPAGTGIGFLIDGAEANSLFHLEINNPAQPRTGQAYYGWLSGGAGAPVALGEIPVNDATLLVFEGEIGFNGLLEGYDTFTAYMGAGPDADTTGELAWTGQIDPTLREAYEQLLIADAATPEGAGSLRTVKDTTEAILAYTDETIASVSDVAQINARGEAIANTIRGLEEDLDDDGTSGQIEGYMPIIGDDGLILLILEDLGTASASVGPGHPVKDLANWAYDCTQRIEGFATYAANRAGIATVCAAESSCDEVLFEASENLEWALSGNDVNGDSSIDPIEEGTIDCAVYYVSQMAYMEIATP